MDAIAAGLYEPSDRQVTLAVLSAGYQVHPLLLLSRQRQCALASSANAAAGIDAANAAGKTNR